MKLLNWCHNEWMNVLNESNHMMNQMILIIKQPSIQLRNPFWLNRIVFRLGSSLRAKFKLSKQNCLSCRIFHLQLTWKLLYWIFHGQIPWENCNQIAKQELSFKWFLSADESWELIYERNYFLWNCFLW